MYGGMWSLPVSNKIFFTFFLFSIAVAVGLGFFNYYDKIGFLPRSTIRYYCGDEAVFNPDPSDEEYELQLDEGMFFEKSYRELLGVTHAHLFSMPIVVFVLSRILAMTKTREGLKIIIYSCSFAGVVLNLIAPWTIRFVSYHFAYVFILSSILLALSFGAYISIPIYELWLRRDHKKDNDTDI